MENNNQNGPLSESNHPEQKDSLKDKIPLPLNLYVGKATVDLLQGPMSKDYISGDPSLSEAEKHKRWKTMEILLAIFIVLFVALMVMVQLNVF
jgi:hypothetical protein